MNSSDKNPLANMQAEQGILGTLMLHNAQFWDVAGLVSPDDFAWPVHGEIFSAISSFVQADTKATAITLGQRFEGHEALFHLGGNRYLVELMTEVPLFNTAADYAKIIADLSQRRKIVAALDSVRYRVVTESAKGAEILADISRILDSGPQNVIRSKVEVAMAAVNSVTMPAECFSTGIEAIDRAMFGGLYAGFTYGIGGAEKRGKTTLAHSISHNLNQAGVLHAYLALEMGSVQIEQRNLARTLGINSLKFLKPDARNDAEFLRMGMEAATSAKDCTLYLDMPSGTLEDIQIQLSKLVIRHKIKGFILDYWQLVEGQQRQETEERHLRRVAQWLANFARKHKVFCVLLSQVNDEGKLFAGKGLVKACDQLYTMELGETGSDEREIWLRMTHSRYTPLMDVGTKDRPVLFINRKAGPHVDQHFELPEFQF